MARRGVSWRVVARGSVSTRAVVHGGSLWHTPQPPHAPAASLHIAWYREAEVSTSSTGSRITRHLDPGLHHLRGTWASRAARRRPGSRLPFDSKPGVQTFAPSMSCRRGRSDLKGRTSQVARADAARGRRFTPSALRHSGGRDRERAKAFAPPCRVLSGACATSPHDRTASNFVELERRRCTVAGLASQPTSTADPRGTSSHLSGAQREGRTVYAGVEARHAHLHGQHACPAGARAPPTCSTAEGREPTTDAGGDLRRAPHARRPHARARPTHVAHERAPLTDARVPVRPTTLRKTT